MSEPSRSIPLSMRRAIRFEAGDRCAITTCRGTSALEFAHIVPWREVREHSVDNLILLCAVCHTRYDKGEIDRKVIYMYKRNLATLNSRYSDFERRILLNAARTGERDIRLPLGNELQLLMLLEDGHLELIESEVHMASGAHYRAGVELYRLTDSGVLLVNEWRSPTGLISPATAL